MRTTTLLVSFLACLVAVMLVGCGDDGPRFGDWKREGDRAWVWDGAWIEMQPNERGGFDYFRDITTGAYPDEWWLRAERATNRYHGIDATIIGGNAEQFPKTRVTLRCEIARQ